MVLFYIYTKWIILEYSYSFVYYQHWYDIGAVWLGAGRDTQTFLAAYTTCSLSSDSPAKLLKISSLVMRGIEIFKNWQICELNTCSLSSDSQFQFLSWEELKSLKVWQVSLRRESRQWTHIFVNFPDTLRVALVLTKTPDKLSDLVPMKRQLSEFCYQYLLTAESANVIISWRLVKEKEEEREVGQ